MKQNKDTTPDKLDEIIGLVCYKGMDVGCPHCDKRLSILNWHKKEQKKLEKAYGGCHNCYGKGYATYRYGTEWFADFPNDKGGTTPQETHMVYCKCDRGKQLKVLIEKREKKLLERVRKKVVSAAIKGGEQEDEWKGIHLYDSVLRALSKLKEEI